MGFAHSLGYVLPPVLHYVLLIRVHLDANLAKFTTALAAGSGWMFSIQQEVLLCKATCFHDVQESGLLCLV